MSGLTKGIFWLFGALLLMIIGGSFAAASVTPLTFLNVSLSEQGDTFRGSVYINDSHFLILETSGSNFEINVYNYSGNFSGLYSSGSVSGIGSNPNPQSLAVNGTYSYWVNADGIDGSNPGVYKFDSAGNQIDILVFSVSGTISGLTYNGTSLIGVTNAGEIEAIQLNTGSSKNVTYAGSFEGIQLGPSSQTFYVLNNTGNGQKPQIVEYDLSFNPTGIRYEFDVTGSVKGLVNRQNAFYFLYDGMKAFTEMKNSRLNLTFYNEVTNELVTDSITVEIVGNTTYNQTITDGTLNISEIQSNPEYLVTYYSEDTFRRNAFINVPTFSQVTENLYLLDQSNGTSIIATVKDQNFNNLEGSIIQVLRFFPSTNSYELVEEAKTSFDGTAPLHVQSNSALYKFRIIYNGVVRSTTVGSIINDNHVANGLNFRANTEANTLSVLENLIGVSSNVTHLESSSSFLFSYYDSVGSVQQGCLDIIRRNSNGESTVNTSCSTSSSTTLMLKYDNTTEGEYIGVGRLVSVDDTGEEIFLVADIKQTIINLSDAVQVFGPQIFYWLGLFMIGGLLTLQTKGAGGIIVVVAGTFLFNLAGLTVTSITAGIVLLALAIMVLYIMKQKT